jgi:WD40 repeat protein
MRVLRAAAGEVRALGFSPDGRGLVAGDEKALHAWDLGTDGPPVRLAPGGYFGSTDLFFSPDGPGAYWMSQTGRVGADRTTGRPLAGGPLTDPPMVWFAQSSDGTRLFTAHDPLPGARLAAWRPHAGEWVREWAVSPADPPVHYTLTLDPTGDRLAHLALKPEPRTWPETYRLVVRDTETGTEVGYGHYPYSVEPDRTRLLFRPDGKQLIGVHKLCLLVWPIPGGGKPELVRNDSRKHFTAAAFHPSGRYLFTTSNDTTVTVWDAASWGRVTRFTWQVGRLRSVAVSLDGALAAAGSDSGQVIVWDVDL